MMALQVPAANDRKRVKVYELKENDWFDRGTGFCTGQFVNVSIKSEATQMSGARSAASRVVCYQVGQPLTLRDTGGTSSLCRIRGHPRAHAARDPDKQGGCIPEAARLLYSTRILEMPADCDHRHTHSMDRAEWDRYGVEFSRS
jgi:hypothetical protein